MAVRDAVGGLFVAKPSMISAAENPFRVQRLHALSYHAPDLDWDRLLRRLAGFNYRAAIVGSHGHGKTTLLGALGARLERQGFTIHRARPPLTWPPPSLGMSRAGGPQDLLLVDGADGLSTWAWRRLLRRTGAWGGLIAAQHQPGRLPVLYECRTSPGLMEALLERLIPDQIEETRPLAHRLFETHHGDVRAIFFDLYDRWAAR